MSDKKYCPNCQIELALDTKTCPDCGFEFIVQEKKEQTNAIKKGAEYDPTPGFLWSALSFLFPVVGLILFFVFRKKWVFRSEHCKDGVVIGLIVFALVGIFAFFFRSA